MSSCAVCHEASYRKRSRTVDNTAASSSKRRRTTLQKNIAERDKQDQEWMKRVEEMHKEKMEQDQKFHEAAAEDRKDTRQILQMLASAKLMEAEAKLAEARK